MSVRNCFVSYHHENDQKYLHRLRKTILNARVSDYSLKDDIGHFTKDTIYKKVREKMRNCSVTIVLIGDTTGHRKWIDWEVWASLRSYTHPSNPLLSFKPNGLLVIFLPVSSHSIPARVQDNINSGYAVCMKWENLQRDFENKISFAYSRRTKKAHRIDNTRPRQERNYFDFFGFKL